MLEQVIPINFKQSRNTIQESTSKEQNIFQSLSACLL